MRIKYLAGLFVFVGAETLASSAHAGISDWINNYFVFREEQKELVAPNRDLPPVRVTTPSYNEDAARAWSNYYTREDLQAVPYMDNSTVVMRPSYDDRAPVGNAQDYMSSSNRPSLADEPRTGVRLGAPEQRPQMQQAQRFAPQQQGVVIGDPGESPYIAQHPGVQVGKKTQISEPVRSWKDTDTGQDVFATPRPGDYDYQRQRSRHVQPERIAAIRTPAQTPEPMGSQPQQVERGGYYQPERVAQPSRQTHLGDPNLVNNYTVERGDSLSGISGKEKIYGDWHLWPIIYDANKSQISDPDLIHPGQNFDIPRDHTENQRRGAWERAANKRAPYDFYDGE